MLKLICVHVQGYSLGLEGSRGSGHGGVSLSRGDLCGELIPRDLFVFPVSSLGGGVCTIAYIQYRSEALLAKT